MSGRIVLEITYERSFIVVRSPRSESLTRFCTTKSLIFFVILLKTGERKAMIHRRSFSNVLRYVSDVLMTKFSPQIIVFVKQNFLCRRWADLWFSSRCLHFVSIGNDKWTMLIIVRRGVLSLSHTRTHRFWSSADHAPSLGMSVRGVMVRPHRNLGQVTGERISLCHLPKHTRSFDFLPFQTKRVYLAHCGIIGFVLIQFLLHGIGEFEHLLVFASIANGRIFPECSTESSDLFGDDIEMRRS